MPSFAQWLDSTPFSTFGQPAQSMIASDFLCCYFTELLNFDYLFVVARPAVPSIRCPALQGSSTLIIEWHHGTYVL